MNYNPLGLLSYYSLEAYPHRVQLLACMNYNSRAYYHNIYSLEQYQRQSTAVVCTDYNPRAYYYVNNLGGVN